jgi:transposase
MTRPPPIPVDLWDAIPPDLRPAIATVVAGLEARIADRRRPGPALRQIHEVPAVRPHVTEYRRHRLACPRCGAVTCAPLPAEAVGYGPQVRAACALLAGGHRFGKRVVARVMGDLFGLPISPAAVCDLQARTAAALALTRAAALAYTRPAPPVLTTDRYGVYTHLPGDKRQVRRAHTIRT